MGDFCVVWVGGAVCAARSEIIKLATICNNMGLRVQGMGFRVQAMGFRVQGMGFEGSGKSGGYRPGRRENLAQAPGEILGFGPARRYNKYKVVFSRGRYRGLKRWANRGRRR